MPDDARVNRRNFFRHGLRELLKPLSQAAGPIEEVIKQIGSMEDPVAPAQSPPPPPKPLSLVPQGRNQAWHRPPGALPEEQFVSTCSRCKACVNVCPAQCIILDTTGARGGGVPFIDVDAQACVLCDGLLCMHECPTGALVPTPLVDIDMGTAVWRENLCLRTRGEDCVVCVDRCPVGEMALKLDGNRVQVIQDGCTGCGMCQHSCPTSPKSIFVDIKRSPGPVSRPRS